MTSPAPLRSAAVPTRNAEPVFPVEPATTRSCPELPLCASTLRRGRRAAIPRASSSRQCGEGASVSSTGAPRSTISIRPTGAVASMTSPSLQTPMVAVTSARKTIPAARPLSASRPEGMSTAIFRPGAAFIAAIAAAGAPSTAPRNPVPNIASTTAATDALPAAPAPARRLRQSASSVESPASSTLTPPAASSAARAAAASPFIFALGAASRRRTVTPLFASWRAATNPSPPFEPPPQTITTWPGLPPSSRRTISATPRPALSMSRSVGTPSARATPRSAARISAAVSSSGKSTRSTARHRRRARSRRAAPQPRRPSPTSPPAR